MNLRGLRFYGLLAAMLLAAFGVWAAPVFPQLTGRVVDDAGVLDAGAKAQLAGEFERLEWQTSQQVVVATIKSLGGYSIEDYGYQLGRAWGIGAHGKNNGLLLIVAPKERKVRIEVGYGLEGTVTDALASTIIQSVILPKFKAGDLQGGIVAGAHALEQVIGGHPEEVQKLVQQAPQATSSPLAVAIWLVIIVGLGLGLVMMVLMAANPGATNGMAYPYMGGFVARGLVDLLNSGGGGGGFSGGGGSFGGGGSSGSW